MTDEMDAGAKRRAAGDDHRRERAAARDKRRRLLAERPSADERRQQKQQAAQDAADAGLNHGFKKQDVGVEGATASADSKGIPRGGS